MNGGGATPYGAKFGNTPPGAPHPGGTNSGIRGGIWRDQYTEQVQLVAGGLFQGPAGEAAGLVLESEPGWVWGKQAELDLVLALDLELGPGPAPVEQVELVLVLGRVPVEQAGLVPVLEQDLELEPELAGQAEWVLALGARRYSSRSESQASSDTWSIRQASASDESAPSDRRTGNDTFPAKGAVAHIALPKPEG
uniref:Uncharacterized protein n=1 Tax=Sphaerodactylus townsendi TaxID=933632 RepID=A0ACB8ELL4_9SAUR